MFYLGRADVGALRAPAGCEESEPPLREQLVEQFNRGVKKALLCVLHLPQQETAVSQQHFLPPVWEVQQQTLQGILRYQTQLIVHVDGQPARKTLRVKHLTIRYYDDISTDWTSHAAIKHVHNTHNTHK